MLLSRHSYSPRQERFAHVIRVREIQDRIAQQHHQLFMFAPEETRQRLIADLHHDSFSHPLPELRLRSPELSSIAANDESSFLFALLFLNWSVWFYRHPCTLQALRV